MTVPSLSPPGGAAAPAIRKRREPQLPSSPLLAWRHQAAVQTAPKSLGAVWNGPPPRPPSKRNPPPIRSQPLRRRPAPPLPRRPRRRRSLPRQLRRARRPEPPSPTVQSSKLRVFDGLRRETPGSLKRSIATATGWDANPMTPQRPAQHRLAPLAPPARISPISRRMKTVTTHALQALPHFGEVNAGTTPTLTGTATATPAKKKRSRSAS